MSPTPPARPRQVTLAAWLIMVGSVVVVAMVFDRLAGLHTLETRESVERFLAEPPGEDLGVGVHGVLTLLRTVAMVAAGCATAAAILGYQVLRRSRSARLALTVLAVPLFFTGLVTGGFVSSVVAASAAMLWLQPARDWFRDGPSSPPASESTAPATPPVAPTAVRTSSSQRPLAVVWACVLTWVFCGLTAAGMAIAATAIAVRPEQMFAEMHRQNPELAAQGVSDHLLATATYVMTGLIVLWCLGAAVLAVLVFRRVDWARIVLIVSASVCAALCLLGTAIGAFLLLFPLVAAVVTIALLVRPDTRPWFR